LRQVRLLQLLQRLQRLQRLQQMRLLRLTNQLQLLKLVLPWRLPRHLQLALPWRLPRRLQLAWRWLQQLVPLHPRGLRRHRHRRFHKRRPRSQAGWPVQKAPEPLVFLSN
jgi:hypothetical protein